MLTFIRCFALLIGDLVCDCDERSLFLLLREIVALFKHLKKVGPLKYISSMRFESVHKILKSISYSSNNKITIFIIYQNKLVDFFLNYNDIINSKIEEGPSKLLSINILEKYGIDSQLSLQYISYLQYEHLFFKPGMVLHIGSYEDDIPLFGKTNNC